MNPANSPPPPPPPRTALIPALVLALASGAASALEFSSDTSGFSFSPYHYAKATLKKASSFTGTGDDAATTFYVVAENTASSGALDLQFDAGRNMSGSDTVLLYVTLAGMAFHDEVDAYTGDTNADDFSLISGGRKGDTSAVLRYTGSGITDNDDATDHSDRVTIDIGTGNKLGIGAEQVGGIEVALVNTTLEEILGTGKARTTASEARAVEGVPGYERTVIPFVSTARASQGFKTFDDAGTHLAGQLGSLEYSLVSDVRAADGAALTFAQILDSTSATSRARLIGDLSFVEKVAVVGSVGKSFPTCPSTGVSWPIADGATMTEWLSLPVAGSTDTLFFSPLYASVCIEVKADTAIPPAGYRLELEYAPPSGASFADYVSPFTGHESMEIGGIRRDGTSIAIPYLTTHESYNHRFQIVNSGPGTGYEFAFTPEPGIVAEPGAKASGTLPRGTTHLRASELVTLSGGSRTAATFTAGAEPDNIEMSSVLVSRTRGETDLAVLEPGPSAAPAAPPIPPTKTRFTVSNLAQPQNGGTVVGNEGGLNVKVATGFTTGPRVGGYTLESVRVRTFSTFGLGTPGDLVAAIHAPSSNPANPADTALTILEGPNPTSANTTYTYRCTSNCGLSASAGYFLMLSFPNAVGNDALVNYSVTNSDSETTTPSGNGWLIANGTRRIYPGVGWQNIGGGNVFHLEVVAY